MDGGHAVKHTSNLYGATLLNVSKCECYALTHGSTWSWTQVTHGTQDLRCRWNSGILRIKHSSSLATNESSYKGYDVSCWMWSRREQGSCLDVARVLELAKEIDESTSVGINCSETSATEVVSCLWLASLCKGTKPKV